MSIYRIKQFYRSIVCKINDKDINFIERYLENVELKLFRMLPVYDQKHCINVARDVKCFLSLRKLESKDLIKVALLHDIGKIYNSMNPIDKSIMVIMNKITNGKIKSFNNIKKVNVYYNHGEIGYNILKKYKYDDRFLFLIRNHHNNNVNDIELDLLKECDDRN